MNGINITIVTNVVTTRCEVMTKVLSQQERLPNPLALHHWTWPISKVLHFFHCIHIVSGNRRWREDLGGIIMFCVHLQREVQKTPWQAVC